MDPVLISGHFAIQKGKVELPCEMVKVPVLN